MVLCKILYLHFILHVPLNPSLVNANFTFRGSYCFHPIRMLCFMITTSFAIWAALTTFCQHPPPPLPPPRLHVFIFPLYCDAFFVRLHFAICSVFNMYWLGPNRVDCLWICISCYYLLFVCIRWPSHIYLYFNSNYYVICSIGLIDDIYSHVLYISL